MATIALEIPVRDDAIEFPEIDRASLLLDALEQQGISVTAEDVIDLGAGMGSLSLGAVRRGARSVTAYDVNQARLDEVQNRARAAGLDVETSQLNLLDGSPGQNVADLAFMIGVVEYAGLWNEARSVEALQIQVLRTAWEMLRPGGVLVLGTKNRVWPKLIISEVHTHQPLVAVLPRSLADRLNRHLDGEPYRHHLHSSAGWSRLLQNAGFRSIQRFVPYFSYQFPLELSAQPCFADRKRIETLLTTHPEYRQFAGRAWKPKLLLSSLSQHAHVTVSQSLMFIAQK